MSEHNLPGNANADQGAQGPQQPTPVPSVRLSIHTMTPPIPKRRTSITASDTGSFSSDHHSRLAGLALRHYLTVMHVELPTWSEMQLRLPTHEAEVMALAMDRSEVLNLVQYNPHTRLRLPLHNWFAINKASLALP
jgi:hypothetical protein